MSQIINYDGGGKNEKKTQGHSHLFLAPRLWRVMISNSKSTVNHDFTAVDRPEKLPGVMLGEKTRCFQVFVKISYEF